jgi:hypothetical protein
VLQNDAYLPRLTSSWLLRHHTCMRTTLNIDDDLVRQIKRYAKGRSLSLGSAVSHLVRRGLSSRRPTRVVNGFHVADLPPDSPEVTSELVRRLLDEDE